MWLKKLMHKIFGWEYVIFKFGHDFRVRRALVIGDQVWGKFYDEWILLTEERKWDWVFKNEVKS